MERARIAELIASFFLLGFSIYFLLLLMRSIGLDCVLNLSYSLALMAIGILLLINVFEHEVLFARFYTWVKKTVFKLRIRHSVSPFTLCMGPIKLRINDPASFAVSLLFAIDIIGGTVVYSKVPILGIALIVWGALLIAVFLYRAFFSPSLFIVNIKPSKAGRVASRLPLYVLLSRMRLFNRLYSSRMFTRLVKYIHRLSVRAGNEWAEKWTEIVLRGLINIGLAIGLAITPILAVLFGPCGFAALACPLIVLVCLILYLYAKIYDRRKTVENELPFLALATLLSSLGGLGISFAFEKLASEDFPGISGEYKRFRKLLSGMDPISALNKLGKEHPSGLFREFILGYTSVLLSGGDLHGYLLDRTREFFALNSLSLKKHVGLVTSIMGATVTVLVFIPIFILLSILATPIASVEGLLGQFNVLLPFMGFAAVALLHGQTLFFNKYKDDLRGLVLASIMAGAGSIVTFLLGWKISLIFASAVLSALIGYGVVYVANYRVICAEERSARRFIRDLIELRKIGYSIHSAVKQLIAEKRYDPVFNDVLRDFLAGRMTAQSYVVRAMLRVISVAEVSGSDLPEHLEFINRFFSQYILSREEMKASLREISFMSYLAPPTLAFTLYMIIQWFRSFGETTGNAEVAIPVPRVSDVLVEQAKITVLLVSLLLGVITAKAVDGSIRNTTRPALMLVIALLSLILAPQIASHLF